MLSILGQDGVTLLRCWSRANETYEHAADKKDNKTLTPGYHATNVCTRVAETQKGPPYIERSQGQRERVRKREREQHVGNKRVKTREHERGTREGAPMGRMGGGGAPSTSQGSFLDMHGHSERAARSQGREFERVGAAIPPSLLACCFLLLPVMQSLIVSTTPVPAPDGFPLLVLACDTAAIPACLLLLHAACS